MADSCDPLGAGVVPPGKHLIFGLQLRPGLVQLFCQFPGKTIRRQLNGLPLRQCIQTYLGWGEVEPELFGRFLSREEPLPPVMLGAMAHRWEVLRQENAPLRAVVNGRVRSVGEDFYDEMIRRHLPEGQTKIANIIGEVLGREKPGIGDVWLAERIRQMLSTGELRMLREDRERFYRSVVERT